MQLSGLGQRPTTKDQRLLQLLLGALLVAIVVLLYRPVLQHDFLRLWADGGRVWMVRPSRWMESISPADFRFCFVSDGQANGGQPAFAIAPVRLLAVTSLRGTCRATPLDQTDSGETALARDERRKFRAHRDGASGRRFGDGPLASAGLHPD